MLRFARPPARWVQFLLLAAITLAHVATRLESLRQYPSGKRQFFPESFRYSFALMAGLGMRPVPFSGDPSSIPLQDFLSLQSDEVTAEQFEEWKAEPHDTSGPMERYLTYEDHHLTWPLYTTRVFDLLAAAGIWSVFGIHWDALFMFYLVVSATGPPCLWLLSRSLTGCGWTGLAAALLYACNPLEMVFVSFSPRDISPLWFAAPAWTALACLVRGNHRWPALAASCLLTGLLAGLGLGFRHDALITCVAVAALSVPLVLASGGSRWKAAAAPLLMAAGSRSVIAVIHLACPAQPQQSGVGFHMAYYAEETRCSLFRLENSQGISRDDLQVMQRVAHERLAHGMEAIPLEASRCDELYGPGHARLTREMFLRTFAGNSWTWATRAPEFAWRALRATLLEDLPIGGHIRLFPLRDEPIGGMGRHLLAPMAWLAQAGPVLFIAGVALVAGLGMAPGLRERILALGLAAFAMGYMAVLFLVLPEFKHSGLLVLPMCVLGGAGLTRAVALLSAEGRATAWASLSRGWITFTGMLAAAIVVIWIASLPLAWNASRKARQATARTVDELAGRADWIINRGDPISKELRRRESEVDKAEVWLLEVMAEESGVRLACRQAHHDGPVPLVQYHQSPSTLFQTWHRIPRGQPCVFALTMPGHGAFGDRRADQVRVDILGKGRILRVARVPLDPREVPWLRTMVTPGETTTGNPGLRSFTRSGVTAHGTNTRLPVLGMRPSEIDRWDNPAADPERDESGDGFDPQVRRPNARKAR